jgi:hypothetical protein
MHFSERDFPMEYIKKTRWTINYVYPYVWKHHMWPLCASFFLLWIGVKKTLKRTIKWTFLPNLFQLAQRCQRRRFKCKTLDDRCQVVAILHMTIWVRWAKNNSKCPIFKTFKKKINFQSKKIFHINKHNSLAPCGI